jgi:hypothetical protein
MCERTQFKLNDLRCQIEIYVNVHNFFCDESDGRVE